MTLRFTLLAGRYAVARCPADAPTPRWSHHGPFTSVTRTREELSIVCEEAAVPHDVRAERGWRTLKLEGPIPFETTGVAARFTSALAARAISLFVVSTFDTDYLLVKEESLAAAIAALADDGHEVTSADPLAPSS